MWDLLIVAPPICAIALNVAQIIFYCVATLTQRFSNHGLRPKRGSPRFYEWVADKSRARSTLVIFNS